MSQDGDIGLSTFTPAKLAFIYGQDTTSERFKDSAIFGNFNQNTNSVNISDEQSGNSGQGTSSDIGGCSKNLIHDATADGGRADIEMSEDESITSGSVASEADVQDIQTNKSKRPNQKTRNRMKRQQENTKRLLKSTVDNDQSKEVPNDTEDTNTETDGKKADSNVEIQNKGKDGMSHTNNDDKSNKDINKSNKDNDNKSESEICQKGATSSQHINNENGKTKVQPDTGKEKNKTETGKTGNSSKTEEQKPDANKNKNEANNSSKGSQSNSSGKTNDKGNTCTSDKPQVLLEKSH